MLISCSICRFLFTLKDSDIMSEKAICCIPCGHSFHHKCIMNWFKRDKSCPQCRSKAREEDILYLYFTLEATDDDEEEVPNSMCDKLSKMRNDLTCLAKISEEFDRQVPMHYESCAMSCSSSPKAKKKNWIIEYSRGIIQMVDDPAATVSNSSAHYIDSLHGEINESMDLELGDGFLDYLEIKEERFVEPFAKKTEACLTLLDHCTEQAESLKRKLEKMKKEINVAKQEKCRKENQINSLEFRLSSITKDYQSITKDYQSEMKKKRELKEVIKRICNETEDSLDQARNKVEKWKKTYLTNQRMSESSCSSDSGESMCPDDSTPLTVNIDLTSDTPLDESSSSPLAEPVAKEYYSLRSRLKDEEPSSSTASERFDYSPDISNYSYSSYSSALSSPEVYSDFRRNLPVIGSKKRKKASNFKPTRKKRKVHFR